MHFLDLLCTLFIRTQTSAFMLSLSLLSLCMRCVGCCEWKEESNQAPQSVSRLHFTVARKLAQRRHRLERDSNEQSIHNRAVAASLKTSCHVRVSLFLPVFLSPPSPTLHCKFSLGPLREGSQFPVCLRGKTTEEGEWLGKSQHCG